MEIVYLDSLFFLNLAADYLLCLAAAGICGLVLRRGRYLLAAALGGLYAAAVWLPGLGFLAGAGGKLGAALLMGLIAFGGERRPLLCLAVYFAVTAAFGGALWALGGQGMSLRALMLCFFGCWLVFRLLLRGRARLPEKRRVEVALRFLGREARFFALVDSGNELRDAHTGLPVLVVCPEALRPVLREHTALFASLPAPELLARCAELPALRGKLRLLPFSAVGGGGLLPLFRPEALSLGGRDAPDVLVAVSPQAAGDGYEALAGPYAERSV